jgi:hypothetical protein
MTDGVVQVAFAPTAALGNPARAGSYTIAVRQARALHSVPIAIRP